MAICHTLRPLLFCKDSKGGSIMYAWNEELIAEYKLGRKQLQDRLDLLDADDPEMEFDRKKIAEMISDMDYSIEWMRRGRRPGNLRGIDRRSVYERTAMMDMDIFGGFNTEPEKKEIPEIQKKEILEILIQLSHRERECYLMHMAKGFSLSEIAQYLNLSKRTVQQYVDRAKKKITQAI